MKVKGKLFSLYKNFALHLSQSKSGNLQAIASLHSLIIGFLQPAAVEVLGNKLFLDHGDSLRLSIKGIHDPVQTSLIKKYVKSGNVVIDVGAHIGYYTLLFANLVKEKGHVWAFEPSGENFKLLKKNIEVNGCKNVTLINKAVSDNSGMTKLYLSKTSQADHKTYDAGDSRSFIKVGAVSLDDYFREFIRKVDFVKIDVQGSETKVISGMEKIISKNSKIKILTEFWPLGISKAGAIPRNYLKLLSQYNFKLIDINEYTEKIQRLSPDQLLKRYNVANTIVTNILCLK